MRKKPTPNLSENQKDIIFYNYLRMPQIDISIYAKCTIGQIKALINTAKVAKLRRVCRIYNQKNDDKSRYEFINDKICCIFQSKINYEKNNLSS